LTGLFLDQRGLTAEVSRMIDSVLVEMQVEDFHDEEEFQAFIDDAADDINEVHQDIDKTFAASLAELMSMLKARISQTVEMYVEEFPAGGPGR
jgi:hypothetical protein